MTQIDFSNINEDAILFSFSLDRYSDDNFDRNIQMNRQLFSSFEGIDLEISK